MFWGITLESNKKYTQLLQKSFCVTMAALGFENPSNDQVYVLAEVNNAHHVLCCLQSGKIPQQTLNLNFTEGELVSFFIEGEGEVHLTGYLVQENNDSDLSDDSSDDENEAEKVNCSAEAENISTNGHPSNHINNTSVANGVIVENGMSTEVVSEVSWQGMLSASQDKDVSDGEIEEGNITGSSHQELEDTRPYNVGMSPVKTVNAEEENNDNDNLNEEFVETTGNNSMSEKEMSDHMVCSADVEVDDNDNVTTSDNYLATSDNFTCSEPSDFNSTEVDCADEDETDHLQGIRIRASKRTRKLVLHVKEDDKPTETKHRKRVKISDEKEDNQSSEAETNSSDSKDESKASSKKLEKKPSTKLDKKKPAAKPEKKLSTKTSKRPGKKVQVKATKKTEKKPATKSEKKNTDKKPTKKDKKPALKPDKKMKSPIADKKPAISK